MLKLRPELRCAQCSSRQFLVHLPVTLPLVVTSLDFPQGVVDLTVDVQEFHRTSDRKSMTLRAYEALHEASGSVMTECCGCGATYPLWQLRQEKEPPAPAPTITDFHYEEGGVHDANQPEET